MLKGKRILLGVSGGIACYKAIDLASQLQQQGALVDVILTEHAQEFLKPLTFSAITHRKVFGNLWEASGEAAELHIGLAEAADLLVIAPATAQTIAKLAQGLADNMLTAVALASKASLVIAPAMHSNMWEHPATQTNIQLLRERGAVIIEPAVGRLASGSIGIGRLPDTQTILASILMTIGKSGDFAGKRVIVTAGGTHEPIDPVRFIGNRSTGKMGFALATAARDRGAKVTLITGPVALTPPLGVRVISVESAREMRDALFSLITEADVLIMSAAVADFRPAQVADHKIKKPTNEPVDGILLRLELVKNPDILAELAQNAPEQLVRVGFAAETQKLLTHAAQKLQKKKLDLLVANDVTRADSGFGTDTNTVHLLTPDGAVEELPTLTKAQVSDIILDRVHTILTARQA